MTKVVILKHGAVGQFYRPMFVVAAGSVDLREANSVSHKQACLSAWRKHATGFIFFFLGFGREAQ